MKLFYTTKEQFQGLVQKPNTSLGGYPSSNEIPNDMLGNIFGSISKLSLQQLPRDTYAIALFNDEEEDYEEVKIYADVSEDGYCGLELAAVEPVLDKENNPYVESIQSSRSLPMFATFYDIIGQENEVNVGGILSGNYLFLWLKRRVLDKSDLFSDTNVIERFNNSEVLPTTDTIEFKISYNKI